MPTISPPAVVLVTGANGYIPIWTVSSFLSRGYSVRGTVRSSAKGDHLLQYFSEYAKEGGKDRVKLELVVVEDITKEGAFDEAVKGVDGIAHMASPFHENVDDPEEFIRPAVQGTLTLLRSAQAHAGPQLKRVVITSSCAAVITIQPTARTFSELDWNEQSIDEVKAQGRAAAPMTKYRASKTLAERAALEWFKERNGTLGWDVTWVNPPFVFGPAIHEIPGNKPENLNTSLKAWYDFVLDTKNPKGRDALGDAHVLALEKEAAGGERIIVTAGAYVWQEWLDIANAVAPSIPKGYPDILAGGPEYKVTYDTAKERRVLGVGYRTKEQTVKDTLADFKVRGW
ncbi:D-lactaldehyde dehydrogenase [Coprinellus micaceus]|uniref:D-lactaldehyde dehydrogenase n=1 Tax=Coprinellus micaceus TaxID=71717 RepID=A0A4Y7SKT7_COPMI|nr:D-lactaldehyde dehydrogenase [Coprinellus micaceus]